MYHLSVICPVLNERDNVVKLIPYLYELFGSGLEVIVVDDGSDDGTREVVSELALKYNSLVPVFRDERGLTSAIKEGISRCHGRLVSWFDCDFSHPPSLLPSMVALIEHDEVDCVVASRFLPSSIDENFKTSFVIYIQKVLSWVLNYSCRLVLRRPFTDYTSGFIVIKRDLLTKVKFEGDYGEYFMELIEGAFRQNARIVEVPFLSKERVYGESKTCLNLLDIYRRGINYIATLIRLRFRTR